jgi:hypothetical protein
VLLAGGAVAGAAPRVLPFRLPLTREGPWTLINGRPGDDAGMSEELGGAVDQPSGFVQTTDVSFAAYPARSYRRSAPVALPVSTVSTDRS